MKAKKNRKREYEFVVYIPGQGRTREEAWAQACEHISAEFNDFASRVPEVSHVGPELPEL